MVYTQIPLCEKWMFVGLPAFEHGKMQPLFADCGCGLENDFDGPTGKDSFMHTFDGVSGEDFISYIKKLENMNIKKTFENEIDGNLFYRFATKEGNFSAYYRPYFKTARFILDQCDNTDADKFGYSEYEEINGNTVFSQYSLHYAHMIRGYSTDCGMNYVYRLRDNSLIIIDGGEIEQATDRVIEEYFAFLRRLTGTKAGEKMRISLWLCTHAHNDHADFFTKLIRVHGDDIILERTAFNFPLFANVKHSQTVLTLKQRIKSIYPNAKYLKIRAGDVISIANAVITVLSSSEDAVCFDEDGDDFTGLNDTSSVFTVEADGVKTLFLADTGRNNQRILIHSYKDETLQCNIMQIAHHGINYLPRLYEKIKAEKALLPQARLNMITRFQNVLADLYKNYGERNIIYAYDVTSVFTLQNGEYSLVYIPHSGSVYDNSEL